MPANPFYRLAPFIQEYIYNQKWDSLREVQAEAIPAILDGREHILISSATASGKTEAALLPIITDLASDPPASVGALYIGPLKALINDQFYRIAHLLEGAEIPVQSWHGDVPAGQKRRFLRRARGILQITPESLEAMLMRCNHELGRLFGDLRYVIIDEAHAFLGSERGRQVICQLERLARVQREAPRRIGLSATLGEPGIAMRWLQGNTARDVRKIEVQGGNSIDLALEYFLFEDSERRAEEKADDNAGALQSLIVDKDRFYRHLHSMIQRELKTLVFANSRGDVEDIGFQLRAISDRAGKPNFYHVHHGSISAPLRETAEEAMRATDKPACVAATVTLELGIDLGQLDQILQVNSTWSVSSFVQRLGRSGRRAGMASRMFFYSTEMRREASHFGDELPWNLLQTIAIIQLYLEEAWIEPPHLPRLPLSLLYHQTMSVVFAHTELSPPQLAERVLSLSPFAQVSQAQYRVLLRHLLEIEHLQRTETGGLIIGLGAEKIVNHYRFYAVFADETLYRVRDKSREIGTLQAAPEVDSTIVLAGYVWRVRHVDQERRIIEVSRAKGRGDPRWRGGGGNLHARILRKVRSLLATDETYRYLHERARRRLDIARAGARRAGLLEASILPLADARFLLFPWCGTRQFRALAAMLGAAGMQTQKVYEPYYIVAGAQNGRVKDLRNALRELLERPPDALDLANRQPALELRRNKYDAFVPEALLREAYAADALDVPGAREAIQRLLA